MESRRTSAPPSVATIVLLERGAGWNKAVNAAVSTRPADINEAEELATRDAKANGGEARLLFCSAVIRTRIPPM